MHYHIPELISQMPCGCAWLTLSKIMIAFCPAHKNEPTPQYLPLVR